jgi:transposase-like protein
MQKRWTARRKAELVKSVQDGAISIEAACEAHSLSIEEFQTWLTRLGHGVAGLQTTHIQLYR